MVLLDKLCANMTGIIKDNVKSIDDKKAEIINYGLYLWITDLIKLTVILLAACFLGILKNTIIFLISFGVLRTFAGGSHARTFWGCLLTNSFITFCIVYLSLSLSFISPLLIFTFIAPFCTLIIYLYAPADHENKPVVSKKQRKRLKIAAYSVLFAEYMTAVFINQNTVSNTIILSTFSVCIGLLPITYKIMGNRHGIDYK